MHIYEKADFCMAMEALRAAFPIVDSRYNKLLDTYFTYLQDVHLIRITKAIRQAVLTLDTFPTINKLRTLAGAHDIDDNCDICSSNNVRAREQHIHTLARSLYQTECQGDLTWLLERIYAHAKTSYHDHPEIAKWVEHALELANCSASGQPQDPLRTRAERLCERAPWILEQVVAILLEHRRYWESRVRDMETLGARTTDDALVHQVGLQSIAQILQHGEQTYAKVTKQVMSAAIHETGKPRLGEWQAKATAEGREKLALMRAAHDEN